MGCVMRKRSIEYCIFCLFCYIGACSTLIVKRNECTGVWVNENFGNGNKDEE